MSVIQFSHKLNKLSEKLPPPKCSTSRKRDSVQYRKCRTMAKPRYTFETRYRITVYVCNTFEKGN